jgi:hypothetical protein
MYRSKKEKEAAEAAAVAGERYLRFPSPRNLELYKKALEALERVQSG